MEMEMATGMETAMGTKSTERFEGRCMLQSTITAKLSLLLFLLIALGTAIAQSGGSSVASGPSGSTGFGSGAAGPIGAGDLIEMSVFDTPELSGKLRVSNTGDIFLPLVGSLHVQGLKAQEAQTLIRQKFIDGGFLKDPQVTVFISEYSTQGVSVVGEVHKPGIYPAFGSHRLLDYISLAEGLTPLAGTTVTITHVGYPDQPQHFKMIAGAAPSSENNPEILPGDTIFVEKTGLVYVVGDVVRPGGFPMDHDEHLTILQAVALAQGTNYTAAKGSVRLIRTTATGREEIPIDLKKVFASKAEDMKLQDNDILFIPNSMARSALKAVAGAAVPAAATATIYRVP
jgi:polysaccharide biosynthesis/export protein